MTSESGKRRLHFTRKEDLKRTELSKSGFGKSHSRKDYSFHGNALISGFQSAVQIATQTVDAGATSDVLMEIETPKSLKVKNVRHQLAELEIKVVKLDSVRENFATASVQKAQLQFLSNRLQSYAGQPGNPYKGSISLIESIQPFTEETSKIDPEIREDIVRSIVSVFTHLSFEEKLKVCQLIVNRLLVMGVAGEVVSFYEKYILGVSASVNREIAEVLCKEFMFIESIITDHVVDLSTLRVSSTVPSTETPLPVPQKASGNFKIGIVDSGIAKNHMLKPFIRGISAQLPVGTTNVLKEHGTFVASRALFGDDFDYLYSTGEAVANLHDITVFGINASGGQTRPTETDIIRAIGKALTNDNALKIINLSIGFAPVTNWSVSRLANFIDESAKAKKVIFTVASGNAERPLLKAISPDKDPSHRITSPGEAIYAVTVASYARRYTPTCSATLNSVSSFSRLGPGFDGGLKPDVVLSGGNSAILKDPFGNEFNEFEAGAGVLGLDVSGGITENIGTSFAAPVAANHFAQLINEYPDANPNFYRALYFHSCANGLSKPLPTVHSRHFYGLGVPDINSIIFNSRRSVLTIAEDKLRDDKYLEIPFHVPQVFASTAAKLGIRVTIVYDPDVDVANPAEYVQSRLSAAIMKPGPVGRRQVNLDGTGDNYYKQWSPIINWTGTFDRNFMAGEWNLRLRLYKRFSVAKDYEQPFCAIIEIFDPANGIDVEAEVRRDFPLKYGTPVGTAS